MQPAHAARDVRAGPVSRRDQNEVRPPRAHAQSEIIRKAEVPIQKADVVEGAEAGICESAESANRAHCKYMQCCEAARCARALWRASWELRRSPRSAPRRLRRAKQREASGQARDSAGPPASRATESRGCLRRAGTESSAKQSREELSGAKQSRAELSSAKQSRAELSSAKQSRAEESREEQSRAEESRAEQSRACAGGKVGPRPKRGRGWSRALLVLTVVVLGSCALCTRERPTDVWSRLPQSVEAVESEPVRDTQLEWEARAATVLSMLCALSKRAWLCVPMAQGLAMRDRAVVAVEAGGVDIGAAVELDARTETDASTETGGVSRDASAEGEARARCAYESTPVGVYTSRIDAVEFSYESSLEFFLAATPQCDAEVTNTAPTVATEASERAKAEHRGLQGLKSLAYSKSLGGFLLGVFWASPGKTDAFGGFAQ